MSEKLDLQSVHEALRANRKAYEDSNAEAKAVYEKTEKFLEKQEEQNQKIVQEMAAKRKTEEEFKERLDSMEAKLLRPGAAGDKETYAKEKKAFEGFLRKGKEGMQAEELKTLNTESGPDGGFLIPTELSNEILKKVIEISDVASVARVRNMGKLFRQPIRGTIPTVYRTGEMQSTTPSQSSYENKELVAKTLTAEVRITRQELEDAAYNMSAQIAEDVAIAFAERNGQDFVNGVGSPTVPQGFMSAPGIESFNSGSATSLTADSLINVTGQLKVGYKPMYAFNRRTRAIIRQLKDSVGNYLWVAGNLGGKVPNELNGYPYIEFINMPDVGANTYPVIFGDFYRGYMIGERQGMFVLRDDYTLASDNIVRFLFNMRNDGLVTLDEAFKKIKISA